MAKLKAPLLSLGASQQLGKALVFFPWKGLNVVREYVVPTNPKSALQTTQRGYLTDAVDAIHDAQALTVNPLDAEDIIAYALLGATHPTPRTWFNEVVKRWLDVKVAGATPVIYSAGGCGNTVRTLIELNAVINEETGSDLAAGKFYVGKSKTALVHSYAAVVTPGSNIALAATNMSAWMAVGDKIYWQFRPDAADPCEGALSGIYTFIAT